MSSSNKPREPLAHVVLVTGKGGVGKTTIAAAIAEASVKRGRPAMLVEFGDGESGRRVLGSGSKVKHRVVEAQQAVQEMAAEVFGSAMLAKIITGNFAMKNLLRAAPALRELGQLEAVRRIAAASPGERVVVDMPATGHGIAWLRVAQQMRDLLRQGPLHDIAARLADELVARGRSSLVVVTLPERLVLKETVELLRRVRDDVGLVPDRVVVNRVPELPAEHALHEAMRLSREPGPLQAHASTLVEVLAARDQARAEALSALADVETDWLDDPVIIPFGAADPSASEVAGWLGDAA